MCLQSKRFADSAFLCKVRVIPAGFCLGLSRMSEEGESGAKSDSEAPKPGYHRVVTDMHFVNISIKTYEKKTGGGFPREEYFAYRIVSMSV